MPIALPSAAQAAATSSPAPPLKKESAVDQEVERARPVVQAAVTEKLGWRPDEYTLRGRRIDQEKQVMVIDVAHHDDYRKAVPGGGKSWQVEYDLRKGTILRWLKFQ